MPIPVRARRRVPLVWRLLLALTTGVASAVGAAGDAMAEERPRIQEVRPSAEEGTVAFDGFVEVVLDRLPVPEDGSSPAAPDFVLHLNKERMPHLAAQIDGDEPVVRFKLAPDDAELTDAQREALRQSWRDLLGSPESVVRLTVDLGYQGSLLPIADDEKRKIHFNVYDRPTLYGLVVLMLLIVAAFVHLARNSNIIRDSGPPEPPPGKRRPYSLARTQMAFWTLLVLGAFGFIYVVTDYHATITEQVLVLLGIASATALSSVAIDGRKSNLADAALDDLEPKRAKMESELREKRARIAELREEVDGLVEDHGALGRPVTPAEQQVLDERRELLRREMAAEAETSVLLARTDEDIAANSRRRREPVSEGFVLDLITDREGVTLHRTQIALWTVVLGAFFVWEVWRHLAMPQFSTELLTLMGISSGTYLGFKFPEQQS